MTGIRDKLNHVLYLEQLKSDETVDTRMYIVYDYEYKEYTLHYTRRAKDNNITNTDEDYEIKFYKKDKKKLMEYVKEIMSLKYNYVNLSLFILNINKDIEYHDVISFDNYYDDNFEITGYNGIHFSKKKFNKYLRFLRNSRVSYD